MDRILWCVLALSISACGEMEASIASLDGDSVKLDRGAFMNVSSTPHRRNISAESGYIVEGSGGAIMAQSATATDGNSTVYLTNQSTIISLSR